MISKVIKKPLVVWLSQVIHKVVIQNPVRNEEGMQLKKWLLLDEDIISNCPSEKAPPQSPIYELNCCHLDRLAFISLDFPCQTGEAGEELKLICLRIQRKVE